MTLHGYPTMSVGERFRASGPRRVAGFINQHQGCDRGFGIVSPGPANHRLRIRCNGCGASLEYTMGGEPRAAGPLARADGIRGRQPTPAGGHGGGPGRGGGRAGEGIGRLPSWLVNAAIAAIIGAGLALIGIGVLGGKDDEPAQSPQNAAAVVQTALPATPFATQQPAAPQPAAPPPAAPQPAAPAAEAPRLQRDRVNSRFDIGLPPSWRRDSVGNRGMASRRPRTTSRSGSSPLSAVARRRRSSRRPRGFSPTRTEESVSRDRAGRAWPGSACSSWRRLPPRGGGRHPALRGRARLPDPAPGRRGRDAR
jgi:hypothetical protein